MARKKAQEQVSGSYSVIPHAVMESTAFMGASHHARSMLFELIRQHKGNNNGHFKLATGWLKPRGWNSNDLIHKVKAELVTRQLAIKTRFGGLGLGPDLWAVTWLPISDFSGLTEVTAKTYHPGAWHFLNQPLPIPKRDAHTAGRDSAAPPDGIATTVTAPPDGAKTVLFGALAAPPDGNNVVTSSPLVCVTVALPTKARVYRFKSVSDYPVRRQRA